LTGGCWPCVSVESANNPAIAHGASVVFFISKPV
jgi:hypothetical protein